MKMTVNGVETEVDLTAMTDEQWVEFEKATTAEYWRRQKVKFLAWFEKAKIGGARVKNVAIAIVAVEAVVLLGSAIYKMILK